ncbi:MAG: YraN family protein [bacterium]|nr:YraN family protein [bacterium]
MKLEPTQKQVTGNLGEDIATRFLEKKGFEIIERNYRKKFGEIDIVAKRAEIVHFVEVKTVSRENLKDPAYRPESDSNNPEDCFRPEDNVHPLKQKRLSRAIQVYLEERKLGEETFWQFDVITILLDVKNKIARVKMLEDIIL